MNTLYGAEEHNLRLFCAAFFMGFRQNCNRLQGVAGGCKGVAFQKILNLGGKHWPFSCPCSGRECFFVTERDKSIILAMRENGESYSAIANALRIPVGTVKALCSREKKTDTNAGVLCLTCGAPIPALSHGKAKRFCSRRCYNKWWHANHTDRTTYNRTCPVCGKVFTVRSNKCQKYCSADCYQAARKAGGEHE